MSFQWSLVEDSYSVCIIYMYITLYNQISFFVMCPNEIRQEKKRKHYIMAISIILDFF